MQIIFGSDSLPPPPPHSILYFRADYGSHPHGYPSAIICSPPASFSSGGAISIIIKIFFFVIVARVPECEESFSKVQKTCKIFRMTSTLLRLRGIYASKAKFCATPALSPDGINWGGRGAGYTLSPVLTQLTFDFRRWKAAQLS